MGRILEEIFKYNQLDSKKIAQLYAQDTNLKISTCESIKKIVERIKLAKLNQEKVLIVGDYDCGATCC